MFEYNSNQSEINFGFHVHFKLIKRIPMSSIQFSWKIVSKSLLAVVWTAITILTKNFHCF